MNKIHINQLGFLRYGHKSALFSSESEYDSITFTVLDTIKDTIIFSETAKECEQNNDWGTDYYWLLDFSPIDQSGSFELSVLSDNDVLEKVSLVIDENLNDLRLMSAITYYFKGQRATGEWQINDTNISFRDWPNMEMKDVHGGWFDASGDCSVHFSHLSHSSWFNPQQTPWSVYCFYRAEELLEEINDSNFTVLRRRILDEGSYGVEGLIRRFDPNIGIVKSITRMGAYDIVTDTRRINYELRHDSQQFEEKNSELSERDYFSSIRSGGGIAVAAMAIAGRHYYPNTSFTLNEIIETAKKTYSFLEKNNKQLINDDSENLVDRYCALLACVELYLTTHEYGYKIKAREWTEKILNSMVTVKNTLRFSFDGNEPFFHPSDEGLPVYSLMRYYEICDDQALKSKLASLLKKYLKDQLLINQKTGNPFEYPTFLQGESGNLRFFFPHNTKAAPWWQGENARICSISTSIFYYITLLERDDELGTFAEKQIDWILGCNPYNVSMIEGFGNNHIQYSFNGRLDFINAPGGICNGVTGDLAGGSGIAFIQRDDNKITDNWRWAEQWIPNASWFLMSLLHRKKYLSKII